MSRNTIRDYFFTLSGYFTTAIEVCRNRHQVCLIVLGIQMVFQIITIFISSGYTKRIVEDYYYSSHLHITASYGWVAVILFVSVAGFFVNWISGGLIYSQSRSYIDRYRFGWKESLQYTCKRFLPFLTLNLALFAIILVASIVIVLITTLITTIGALGFYSTSGLGVSVGMIVIAVFLYLGVCALFIVLMLKWLFSANSVWQYAKGGFQSIDYSNKLTEGIRGKLFGYLMMFLGCNLVIAMISGIVGVMSGSTAVQYVIQALLSVPVSIFSLVYFNIVFINVDALKHIHCAYYNLPPVQDSFIEFCNENNIPKGE